MPRYPCQAVIIEGVEPGAQGGTPISVNPCGHVKLDDGWDLVLRADELLNNTNKFLTVPVGYWEQVLWLWVELTTTATVGARQLVLEIQDSAGDIIAEWRPGVTQAGSLTYYYCFAPGNADLTAVRDSNYIMTPIPPTLLLGESYIVHIWDNNVVDAAADDMIVQMQVGRRAVC